MEKLTIKEMLAAPPLECPICDRPNYHPSDHHMRRYLTCSNKCGKLFDDPEYYKR